MTSIFEQTHLLVRKWLLSMTEGEERLLPMSKCKYENLKATCNQLKKIGKGEWKCSKKGLVGQTRVIRIS